MLQKTRNAIVEKVSQRHVAGDSLRDTLPVGNWASQNGFGLILSPWAGPDWSIKDMQRECQAATDVLGMLRNIHSVPNVESTSEKVSESVPQMRQEEDSYTSLSTPVLSVKLNAFDFDKGLISELYQYTLENQIRLHVDSLSPELASQTFRLLEEVVKAFGSWQGNIRPMLGVTIPTRCNRSVDDLQRAQDMGLAVRLVKGQWPDPDRVVDPLENALRMIRSLQKRGASRQAYSSRAENLPMAVASHDTTYLRETLSQLKHSAHRTIVEQFFSLPLNGGHVAEAFQTPMALYIAYGSPALPYNIRFSVTRPRLALWMASDYLLPRKRIWENAQ